MYKHGTVSIGLLGTHVCINMALSVSVNWYICMYKQGTVKYRFTLYICMYKHGTEKYRFTLYICMYKHGTVSIGLLCTCVCIKMAL